MTATLTPNRKVKMRARSDPNRVDEPRASASLRGFLPLVVLLALWQLGGADSVSFPPPSEWLDAARRMYETGVLLPALRVTLNTFAISLFVAIALGVPAGAVLGASRRIERALTPVMDFFRSLPPPAIVPVATILLGLTLQASVTIIVIAIIWPILLNTLSAMRSLPRVRIDMARSLGLTRREQWQKITLPSLIPGVMVGIKVAISISLIVTLLVDILGHADGVGRLIVERQQRFEADSVWALLLIIGLAGYLLNAGFAAFERRVMRNWPPSGRA